MANKHVHVVVIEGVCRVIPPHVSLAKGDTVTWHAHDSDIVIFDPNQLFRWSEKTKDVKQGGDSGQQGPSEKDPSGVYEYAVYCTGHSFAVGASHPIIIIDRW